MKPKYFSPALIYMLSDVLVLECSGNSVDLCLSGSMLFIVKWKMDSDVFSINEIPRSPSGLC